MNKYLKISLGVVIGAIGGYAYYHFFGCNGTCPLTSNWHVTTLYGAVVGLVLALPGRKEKNGNKSTDSNRGLDQGNS